jgi:hypothetical protein
MQSNRRHRSRHRVNGNNPSFNISRAVRSWRNREKFVKQNAVHAEGGIHFRQAYGREVRRETIWK